VNPLPVLVGAAAGWGLAAVLALAVGTSRAWIRACCAVSGLAGAAALAGGGASLLSGDGRVITAGGSVAVGTAQLQVTSLAGVFAALLGLVAVATAAYVPRYHEPGRATGVYLAVYNLALLASLAVLAAGNVVTFLVAWETMALLCYLLILRRAAARRGRRGGVLVPGPVRDRVRADRGGVRDPGG
jgi:hydrogenase-4 component B